MHVCMCTLYRVIHIKQRHGVTKGKHAVMKDNGLHKHIWKYLKNYNTVYSTAGHGNSGSISKINRPR